MLYSSVSGIECGLRLVAFQLVAVRCRVGAEVRLVAGRAGSRRPFEIRIEGDASCTVSGVLGRSVLLSAVAECRQEPPALGRSPSMVYPPLPHNPSAVAPPAVAPRPSRRSVSSSSWGQCLPRICGSLPAHPGCSRAEVRKTANYCVAGGDRVSGTGRRAPRAAYPLLGAAAPAPAFGVADGQRDPPTPLGLSGRDGSVGTALPPFGSPGSVRCRSARTTPRSR